MQVEEMMKVEGMINVDEMINVEGMKLKLKSHLVSLMMSWRGIQRKKNQLLFSKKL